jgi:DNA-binding LacI/PurR family transcriptional regulator
MRAPRKYKKVTIKDVALRSGVSIGAVSRVLHGRASTIRVSESTAEIIRQAALDLQYKSNRSSKTIRNGQTKSLAIAAPFEISLGGSTYYASIVDGIVGHASEKGYTVCLSKSLMSRTMLFEDSKGKYDGIIWLGNPTISTDSEDESPLKYVPQVGIHLTDSNLAPEILNVRADEVQAVINYVGHLRVHDVSKIGLFAKNGESSGLMNDSKLQDLCKRLAIQYFSYKMLDEIPAMIQSSTIEVAMVWQLTDTSELIALKAANSKGARKVGLSAIITDADKLNKKVPGLHFAFPLDEMCKSAVDILISKIENPNVIAAGLALPIPLPA